MGAYTKGARCLAHALTPNQGVHSSKSSGRPPLNPKYLKERSINFLRPSILSETPWPVPLKFVFYEHNLVNMVNFWVACHLPINSSHSWSLHTMQPQGVITDLTVIPVILHDSALTHYQGHQFVSKLLLSVHLSQQFTKKKSISDLKI